jgi:hypothetical protein
VKSFATPLLTSQPVAAAGATIKVAGRFFPETKDPDVLNLVFEHDSICQSGSLELDWGPAGGPTHVDSVPITGCTTRHPLSNLTPATGYEFRARDREIALTPAGDLAHGRPCSAAVGHRWRITQSPHHRITGSRPSRLRWRSQCAEMDSEVVDRPLIDLSG